MSEVYTTQLGKLIHGDCLEVMVRETSGAVDMVLCDLPYGTTRNKWDSVIPLSLLWPEYARLRRSGAPIVLTACQPFTTTLVASNMEEYRYDWIWEKTTPTGHLNAKKRPMRVHESVLVFCDTAPPYYPQKTFGHARKVSTALHKRNSKRTENYGDFGLHTYDSTERYPRSVLLFPTDRQKSALHPTQKPVALWEYLIRTYTKGGDLVLDNCAGSGTTAIACENLNRRWICIEKDPTYFAVAKERIQKHVAAKQVAISA